MPCPTERCDKEMELLGYEDIVRSVVAMHPDFTNHEVRVTAAKLYQPIHRANVTSIRRENSGQEDYIANEFEFTQEGGVYYPEYDMYLDDLGERDKRLTPRLYSETDHQVNTLVGEAFKRGASIVVVSYNRQGEDSRDIIIMELDRNTGRGRTIVINTSPDKRYHTHDSIRQIARERFSNLLETQESGLFILSDIQLNKHQVQSAFATIHQVQPHVGKREDAHQAVSVSDTQPKHDTRRDSPESKLDKTPTIMNDNRGETKETTLKEDGWQVPRQELTIDHQFRQRRIKKVLKDAEDTALLDADNVPVVEIGILGILLAESEKADHKDGKIKPYRFKLPLESVRREIKTDFSSKRKESKREEERHKRQKREQREKQTRRESQAALARRVLQEKKKELVGAQKVIAFTRDTGVGIAASMLALQTLAREFPKPLKTIEKSRRRHKRKELLKKDGKTEKPEQRTIRSRERKHRRVKRTPEHFTIFRYESAKKQKRRLKKEDILRLRKENESKAQAKERKHPRRLLRERFKRIKLFELGQTGKQKKRENRYMVFRKEKRSLQAKRLIFVLRETARSIKKQHFQTSAVAKDKDLIRSGRSAVPEMKATETNSVQKGDIKSLTFSFALWLLFELLKREDRAVAVSRVRSNRVSMHRYIEVDHKHSEKKTVRKLKKRNKSFEKKEEPQFVLLSIIWYLTMIREWKTDKYSHFAKASWGKQISKRKKTKKKRSSIKIIYSSSVFPESGVIFCAYS